MSSLRANDMGEFESLLEDASDIATKKSLNVDYLPSVVTVIDAQTFIDGGIQNVGEALGMLPGIQIQLNVLGQTITTVRGFKNPNAFLSDKVKILIDGVAINNEAAGTSSFYMDFPMQLVERIEVLRGPGSTIYGAGAFYGTVNVITKLGNNKEQNQLFVGVGSYQYMTTGANLNTSLGEWKILTDGYYAQNDKSIYHDNQTTDEAMHDFALGLKIVNGGFEFLARYKSSTYGNFYVFKGDIEPNNDKGHTNSYFFSQLSYTTTLEDFKLETKVNFSNRESDTTAYVSNNVASIANAFAVVDVDMQDAFYIRDHQNERNIEAEAILTLPKISSNDISLGIGARKANLSKNDFYSSVENAISENLTAILTHPDYNSFPFNDQYAYWQDPTSTKIFDKTSRTIKYAHIQDLISVTPDIDIVLGARVDNYSDIGTHYSSRAGLVYRANDKLIWKLLYGSAFRAPTFTEAYTKGHIFYRGGDENLSPEKTDTYETALIYLPDLHNKFSINLFYSKLYNVIDLEEFKGTYPGYQNMKDRISKGAEFEYFFRTETAHDLYVNASYVEAEYTIPADDYSSLEIDQSMPDISKLMLKAMYIYHPTNKLSFGTTWQYYSQTTETKLAWIADDPDIDPTVDQQQIVDETITYKFSNFSDLRLTVKNIFNEEVRLPSYYYTVNGGIVREGRNYFLSFTQRF